MEFTAEMIAGFLEGEVVGDKNAKVNMVAKIEEAKQGELAFLSNPKYEQYLYTSNASIIIVKKDLVPSAEVNATMIKVEDPYACFARLLDLYVANKPQKTGRSPQSFVAENASVGENCYLGEFAVVSQGAKIGNNVKVYPQVFIGDNVTVGDNTILYPGVKVYEDCKIGSGVIIHAGTVIGGDGFGFAPHNGEFKKIPQIGNVVIEDNVEIGSNCTIDRATMGSTIIRRGVKLDNLIQIAHNVEIGEHTVAASQVGVAGSTKIGKYCMFGGQVGIAGHISIADRTQIASQSGIGHTVKEEGQALMGSPAFKASLHQRSLAIFKDLPELRMRVFTLEKELKKLTDK